MARTTIEDILECIICLDEVVNAWLCPFCARIACRECWDSILTSCPLCPLCRGSLNDTKLVKCGWLVDLRREVEECLLEKKKRLELEDDLVSVRSQLDNERAILEEERERHENEEQVFSAEREIFLEEKNLLEKDKEENAQKSDLLDVEKMILKDDRLELNRQQADFFKFANDEDQSPISVFNDINFLLDHLGQKTDLMVCTPHDKGPVLTDILNKMTVALNALGEKLVACKAELLEDAEPDAA